MGCPMLTQALGSKETLGFFPLVGMAASVSLVDRAWGTQSHIKRSQEGGGGEGQNERGPRAGVAQREGRPSCKSSPSFPWEGSCAALLESQANHKGLPLSQTGLHHCL